MKNVKTKMTDEQLERKRAKKARTQRLKTLREAPDNGFFMFVVLSPTRNAFKKGGKDHVKKAKA